MQHYMVHSEPGGEFARLNAALAQTGTPPRSVQDNGIERLLRAPPHHRRMFEALMNGRDLKRSEIDRFVAHGVKPLSLFNAWSTQVDRVVIDGEHFEFADDARGEQVFTMAVIGEAGVIDVAAWRPERRALAVWAGVGFALGERQISDHLDRDGDGDLAVFRSPLGWLCEDCHGIVIIRNAAAASRLRNVRVLIAEDELHRLELQAMWEENDVGPRILLRAPGRRLQVAA
jgi:hypothetical protein